MVHGRRYGRLYDVTDVFTTQRVTCAAKEMNRKPSITDNAFFLSPTLYSLFFFIYELVLARIRQTSCTSHYRPHMFSNIPLIYCMRGLLDFLFILALIFENIEDFHMQSFCVYIIAHDGVVKMSEHAEYGECLSVPMESHQPSH